ncbi:hypothetical protein RJT34_02711 [Clitoria ternatea]|uniref:Uncharacterized protein n=1 Tax=Clitoria ternatea TaxID=43366 RepID=A0AAN9KIW4_CLITE
MAQTQSSRYVFFFISSTFVFNFLTINSISALNIGVETTGITVSVSKECSRKLPPLLRYGKYCGLLYSGCSGERPCDGLDTCCMNHDKCVQAKNIKSAAKRINCMNKFKDTRRPTFKGNTCQVDDVIEVINVVMEAALLAGRVLHKP